MTRKTAAELMREMRVPRTPPPTGHYPSVAGSSGAAVTHEPDAEVERKAGHWLRSDGTHVEIASMNPYHRAAAAKKARAAGDEALADELEAGL